MGRLTNPYGDNVNRTEDHRPNLSSGQSKKLLIN